MHKSITLSNSLILRNGDVISLQADDGTFLKRFTSLQGHDAVLCFKRMTDNYSFFEVEIVDQNQIRLISDNKLYLKRFCCWSHGENKFNFISIDHAWHDQFSIFTINSKGDRKVTLQAENGHYLKRFDGYQNKGVIIAVKDFYDPYSLFKIKVHSVNSEESKVHSNCKEKGSSYE